MSKKNEKIDAKELAKKLLNDRTHGAAKVGAKELEKAGEFAEGYKSFMDAAKTEREAVTWAVQAAEEAGFVPFDPAKKYKAGDKVYYTTAARPCAWPSSARRAPRRACASPLPTSTAPALT